MIIELPADYSAGQHVEVATLIPDAGALQDFIVRLLEQRLNGELTAYNQAHEDEEPLKAIATVRAAPSKSEDVAVNQCLVGMSVQRDLIGHRQIDNRGVLAIAIIDQRLEGQIDIKPMWRRGDVVAAILEEFSAGLDSADANYPGFPGWNSLEPEEITTLPDVEPYTNFSGVLLTYSFWQAAGATNVPAD